MAKRLNKVVWFIILSALLCSFTYGHVKTSHVYDSELLQSEFHPYPNSQISGGKLGLSSEQVIPSIEQPLSFHGLIENYGRFQILAFAQKSTGDTAGAIVTFKKQVALHPHKNSIAYLKVFESRLTKPSVSMAI
jgi:hypothetical protein